MTTALKDRRTIRGLNRILAWLLLVLVTGCSRKDDTQSSSGKPHGVHGGHTFEMSADTGIEMEFTLDEKRRRIVIYVQNKKTRKPHALAVESLNATFEADGQSTDVTFTADPRRTDSRGRSSRFTLSLDKLPQQLLASNRFRLKLSYEVGGKTITGTIQHNNDHTHKYRHD